MERLYSVERLAKFDIAAAFKTNYQVIDQALEHYRIPPRPALNENRGKIGAKTGGELAGLAPGETARLGTKSKDPAAWFAFIAAKLKIGIRVRPVEGDPGFFDIERLA